MVPRQVLYIAQGLRFYAHYRDTWLLCSVERDVTVLGWRWLIGPFLLILNILILGTAIGEREGASSKLILASEGIRKALSSPAESEGWIIESVQNTTWAVRKYSADSFKARLPFFISWLLEKIQYITSAIGVAEVMATVEEFLELQHLEIFFLSLIFCLFYDEH